MFLNSEIINCKIESKKNLTVGTILEGVKDNKSVLIYLPDEPYEHVTREYLIGILNTIDKTYFPRLIQELDSKAGTPNK